MRKRKKGELPRGYGGFVLTFEPERTEWLAEHLSSDLKLTESFSAVDWDLDARELVFIVLSLWPFSIAAFGLMERMHGSGGFRKTKMRMSEMHIFGTPVTEREINGLSLGDAVCTPEKLRRVSPDDWNALLDAVCETRPSEAQTVNAIAAQREIERRILGQSNRVDRLNEQRDALGLALDIGNIDRPSALRALEIDKIDSAASILDLIEQQPIHERSMIEHDARMFEFLLGEAPTQAMTFEGRSDRAVRILVTDKTDLETALGVDLIIYHLCYESFLLLQYKRMSKSEGHWLYRVPASSNIHQQLGQMHAVMKKAGEFSGVMIPSVWSYRLNEDPFYFKFCEQFRPDARDSSLVPGITMSASHLDEFLSLPEAIGEMGGISIGYRNCSRYLSNTEFTQLARSGWIGAGQRSTALIKEVLEANVKGGRIAMLAVISAPKELSASGRTWKR